MRPISLQLEGFTSFRKRAEVDFSQLDLFAITGPTGAGKTSLVDALIYALYGRTPRIGERNVADLMTQGAQRLSVLLEFESGGKRYRIARTMRRAGLNVVSKPQLEVHKEGDEWESLAGSVSTIRRQVEGILGLDFDAFTRSVVLPQGEFDRFLKGSSAERRKILTELLQLEIYLRMGRLAREEAERARSEAAFKKELLNSTYAEATEKNRKALQKEVRRLERQGGKLEKRLQDVKELQPTAQELRQGRQDLGKSRQEAEELKRQSEQAGQRRAASLRALEQADSAIGQLEKQVKEAGYDEKLHFDLARLTPRAEQLAEVRKRLRLGREGLEDKKRLQEEFKPRLQAAARQKEETENQVAQVEKDYAKKSALQEEARQRHGSFEAVQLAIARLEERQKLQQQSGRLEKEIAGLEERQKSLQKEFKKSAQELKKAEGAWQDAREETARLRRLHAADDLRRRLEKGQPCPVCEQAVQRLPKPGRHEAVEEAEKRQEEARQAREELAGRRRDLDRDLKALPEELKRRSADRKEVERSLSQIEQQIEKALARKPGPDPASELEVVAGKLAQLEKDASQARRLREQAQEKARQAVQEATQALHQNELLQSQLTALEKQIAESDQHRLRLEKELKGWPDLDELGRQLAAQEKARQQTDRLVEQLAKQQQARQKAQQDHLLAVQQLQGLSEKAAQAEKRIEKQAKQVAKLEKRLAGRLKKLFEALPLFEEAAQEAIDEADRLEAERDRLEGELKGLQSEQARREEQHKQLELQIEEARRLREEAAALEKRRSVAWELGRALQANRFISFIQEEAVRRLAADGTVHLNTLSSGRYSFSVEQDSFEVLDHWNADESRPVATLSGGESFLASLSLALALADSLPEFCTDRERLSLDSLFLDEGFSTLDPETLDTVVQSVETLAQGDRLIGVISHVPELAERLPSRIQVRKSISGSTLVVE